MKPARHAAIKQPDVTRDTILDAAFQEIYRHGFQAASLNNILARTGLTKGALYHHFPTKDALGFAVIDEVVREGLDAMVFAPLRESDTPFATLLEIIRNKAERMDAENVMLGCPLNNLMQEMSPLDETFRSRLNAVMTAWHDTIADALKRGQRQGQVRKDIDADATALFIVSAWEGCIGIAKNMQLERTYRTCVDQMAAYVRTLAAGTRR